LEKGIESKKVIEKEENGREHCYERGQLIILMGLT